MYKYIYPLIAILFITSCKPKEEPAVVHDASEGTYFSVKQFIKDQWDTHSGQPYGLEKKVSMNGKEDVSMTTAYEMDWGPLIKMFFDADISDVKYLGQYSFSQFEDDATFTINYYYEANNPKLFTRKLQVSADATNLRIRSIYIETQKDGKSQKLFYMPLKVISVQEYEKSFLSSPKEIRIEYRFL